VEDGDGERYTRKGAMGSLNSREGMTTPRGGDDDSKESILINIDERIGSQVLSEVYTTRIRGLRTEEDIRMNEGRISFPRGCSSSFPVTSGEWASA
jgi:hypothetical protein